MSRRPPRTAARRLVFALAAVLAAGCAPEPVETLPAGPSISGLVIENGTADALTEVRLQVLSSGAFVACGYIPPHGTCSTTFPLRRYRAADVRLLWTRAGQPLESRPFVVPLPDPLPADTPLEVVIGIGGASGFSALMRPG